MNAPLPVSAPATVEDVRDRLAQLSGSLPRRLRQCADFVAAQSDRIAVSTVAEIAAGAEVPPSTLIRFCQILGFSGYSEMQRLFRDAYAPGLPDYSTRLKNLKETGAGTPAALLAEFLEAGRMSLEALANSVDEQVLAQAVTVLAQAGTIHIVGQRRAFPVAAYLAYAFEKMDVPAMLHGGVGGLGNRFALRPGDAVLAVTFAPYSPETLSLAEAAQERRLPVVGLTDRRSGAFASLCTALLVVPEIDFGAFRSLSATITLALSLAVSVGAARA